MIRLSGHKLSFSRSGMYDYVRIGKYMFTYLRSGLVGISGSIVSSSTHQCCSVLLDSMHVHAVISFDFHWRLFNLN